MLLGAGQDVRLLVGTGQGRALTAGLRGGDPLVVAGGMGSRGSDIDMPRVLSLVARAG